MRPELLEALKTRIKDIERDLENIESAIARRNGQNEPAVVPPQLKKELLARATEITALVAQLDAPPHPPAQTTPHSVAADGQCCGCD